ncbi:DUF58 domain-containing protein [candidate division WOR-3 bacterium]|jgi:uncharacterized protein (DUF58 family)|nr:DUF58 domain-containing protein [candidate division WOR-3 bacterium]
MIDKSIVKKLHYIEIKSKKLVNDVFAGEYLSAFKGQGMEFDEVREYSIGDDIRNIDWNVSARYNKLYVKKFREERELNIMLLVDISKSGFFGTYEKAKIDLAAELGAIFSFSAIKNNDKVGLLLFTDKIEKFIPLKKGRKHVMAILNAILSFKPESKGTSIKFALEYIGRLLTKKSIIILISDFIDKDYEKVLRILNRKHDIVLIYLYDKKEVLMPKIGYIPFEDLETGERIYINTSDRKKMKEFSLSMINEAEKLKNRLKRYGIDTISIETSSLYIPNLIKFFKERIKRRSA